MTTNNFTQSTRPRQTSKLLATRPSKATIVASLLSRKTGASIADMETATGWQPHSYRAFLSGLRKQGRTLRRFKRNDGTSVYRLLQVGAS
ncbi:DUF3489 domain-containing protein [Sphingorhabdus buctiana]|uniref:DUF3489 domain-containing protein n=1 Tax=Sphingorhabdus buctiana TaxID=1508805 RepID=A0ABW4MDI7_9SPHN